MELARQTLGIAGVLGLLSLFVWAVRNRAFARCRTSRALGWLETRWGAAGSRPPALVFERLGRLPLTPQHTLHLVRIQGTEFVVATHPQGCWVVSGGGAEDPTRQAGSVGWNSGRGGAV